MTKARRKRRAPEKPAHVPTETFVHGWSFDLKDYPFLSERETDLEFGPWVRAVDGSWVRDRRR